MFLTVVRPVVHPVASVAGRSSETVVKPGILSVAVMRETPFGITSGAVGFSQIKHILAVNVSTGREVLLVIFMVIGFVAANWINCVSDAGQFVTG